MNRLENPQQEIELEERHQVRAVKPEGGKDEERFNLEQQEMDPEKLAEAKKQTDELLDRIKHSSGNHQENVPYLKEADEIPQLDVSELKNIEDEARKWDRRITNVTDFVPVIGSAKMIIEGFKGKQYMTEKEIIGTQRVFHTVSGVVFLALDLTGVGAIASEVGKGVIKVGERYVFRRIGSGIERKVLEKEASKLAVRGDTRVNKGEDIANGDGIIH